MTDLDLPGAPVNTTAVSYELDDAVATIRLDDGKANVLRTDRLIDIGDSLDRARQDDARVIVVRGREGMFSAGLDLDWLGTLDSEGLSELLDTFSATMLRVLTSPIPTVALVSGHAIAGGAVLTFACDHRIGLRGRYRLQMNEVAIGIPVPAWMTTIARSAVPAPQIYDVLQLARPLTFDDAHRLGTFHELAEDVDRLDELGATAAQELAALDPAAFAATKERLWAAEVASARARLGDE